MARLTAMLLTAEAAEPEVKVLVVGRATAPWLAAAQPDQEWMAVCWTPSRWHHRQDLLLPLPTNTPR